MTQHDALALLKTGRNAFITGPAGSGKTFVVNEYIRYLKEHEVSIGITASTGIAATHMGGMTIHAWAGIGIKDRLSADDLAEIAEKGSVRKKIESAAVLIIDEVSMLHHFRLDMVDAVLRRIKKSEEPFGGIQVVLCGDFFQLPPVSRLGEQSARFIYESESWKSGSFTVCYLSENHRHMGDDITAILNGIRSGEVSEMEYETLMGRRVKSETLNPKSEIEPVRLYTHNVDVDAVNDRELGRIPGPEITYEMISRGRKPLVEGLKRSCLAPEILRLRKGSRVMCVKNNFDKGYVNGTLGVVVSCAHGSDPIIRTAGTPDMPLGQEITIERATWQIEDDGKVLAEISQYPLRLAWAITVHKSQGMSLDAVEVDLSKSFEPGMGYVALSRVRTLAGLRILGINAAALQVHPEVLEYDRYLRELSEKAERFLEAADESEIIREQNAFMARVAPFHRIGPDGRKVKAAKPPKLSTFEKTALLVRAEKPLRDIAAERGVTVETVIAQLERLVEGGPGTGDGLTKSDIAYMKKEISHTHLVKLDKGLEEVSAKIGDDELPSLSSVKSKVGSNVSWNEIRLARVVLGYVKKK